MAEEQVEIEETPEVEEVLEEPAEKLLTQTQVNKIVGKARASARSAIEKEYQLKLEQIQQSQEKRNEDVPRETDADAIYQQVQERFNENMQQRQIEAEMSRVADSYLAKVKLGPDSYSDFDEITKDFDPTAFPQLIYLVSGIDNAADVVYELAKNPSKLVTFDALAKVSPKQAQAELQKLSASILANKTAQTDAKNQNVNAPLDSLQPSRISSGNGKMNVRDLRNQPWLRG